VRGAFGDVKSGTGIESDGLSAQPESISRRVPAAGGNQPPNALRFHHNHGHARGGEGLGSGMPKIPAGLYVNN